MNKQANVTQAAQDEQFEQARAIIASYALEGADDDRLTEVLMQVRDTCGADAFHRVLVLAAAVCDPRFEEYGAADALPILRDLTITNDVNADAEALLAAMQEEDKQALRKAEAEADPYHRAAVRLYRRFKEPNTEQVMRELARL